MEISEKKRNKIAEHILAFLYSSSPKPVFTVYIAQEVARDEEFIKKILLDLKRKNLVIEVKKNPQGKPYLKRLRWKLSDAAYNAYKNAGNQDGK
jgi:DNA-binding IscR family transcriptional regulator